MPRKNFEIISYYEAEGPRSKAMAKKWLKMLETEYNNGNQVGLKSMYYTLKARAAGGDKSEYPTRRFIQDYLSRQHRQQTHKRAKKVDDTIQSVIPNRPNQIIQIDYCYFFWETDGVDDARGKGPIKEDQVEGEPIIKEKEKENKLKVVKKLFGNIKYRGAIVAVDCFTRYAYTRKIEGNINSTKAWTAFDSIRKEAEATFGKFGKIRIVQSDLGSEFHGSKSGQFQHEMKELHNKPTNEGGFYRHERGYTGRSQSQAIVERVNGTLKRMTMKAIGSNLEQGWTNVFEIVTKNYNSNYHSTLKTSPISIKDYEPGGEEVDNIKDKLLKKAIKRDTVDIGVYKPGEYVRIRDFKPDKLGPKYTDGNKAYSKKEDLRALVKPTDDRYNDFKGVYMIHSVRKGIKTGESVGKPARATTYQIIALWQGTDKTTAGRRIKSIGILDWRPFFSNINTKTYVKGAYGRNFTKDALSRVPQDEEHYPYAEEPPKNITYPSYTIESVVGGPNKDNEYKVKWQDYTDTSWAPYASIKDSMALEEYRKKNNTVRGSI